MNSISSRLRKVSLAAVTTLGLTFASTQASALIITGIDAAAHHHRGYPCNHHPELGLGLGFGVLFLFLLPPVGIILDAQDVKGMAQVRVNLYEFLPFLKGTAEGKEIEKSIANRINELRTEVQNSKAEGKIVDRAKNVVVSQGDFKIDDQSQTLSIKLDADWVKKLLSDGDFNNAQIETAVHVLGQF